MKIDRLIGIIAVLQQNRKVTCPYLAQRFEVSRRTINRDIEDICKAGIPIVTTQGAGGGISIMDGFSINTTVFTADELQAIFIGLKSLDSVSHIPSASRLAEKLSGSASFTPLADNMMIDLSSFYKESLAVKIDLLRHAINEKRLVEFHYYYDKGEADKLIEPYLIIYKWSSWYVFGFCTLRQDFRMYKLNRLWSLRMTDTVFFSRNIPEKSLYFDSRMQVDYIVTAVFDGSLKYRLVEEYGEDCFTELEDGHLLFKRGFTYSDNITSWFLGFGDKAEVLEPVEVRNAVKDAAAKIVNKYK